MLFAAEFKVGIYLIVLCSLNFLFLAIVHFAKIVTYNTQLEFLRYDDSQNLAIFCLITLVITLVLGIFFYRNRNV
ncbi:MAG: hypothetical protein NTY12_01415 [Candidatus Falkowbacteria bacterium]|nr:hypothetical protein [Candidatus Falkowbacteria bacterium]